MKPERRLLVTPLTLEVVRELAHLEANYQEWTPLRRRPRTRHAVSTARMATHLVATFWRRPAARHAVPQPRHAGRGDPLLSDRTGRPRHTQVHRFGHGELSGTAHRPPAQRAEVTNLLKGHLLANNAWETCDWRDVEASSSPWRACNWATAFDLKIAPDGEWSQVPIQGTFQQYWEARSFSLRRNFLKYLDTAITSDRPRFEVVAQADPEFVNAVIRLQGEQALRFAQAKEGAAAFLVDLARVFDDADMLRMFGLRHNRKLVATMLAFRSSQHHLRLRGWARSRI